jgi:hypothetical protein
MKLYTSPFCSRWCYYPNEIYLSPFSNSLAIHLHIWHIIWCLSFLCNSLSNIHDSLYFIFHSLGDWVKEESNPALKLALGTTYYTNFQVFSSITNPLIYSLLRKSSSQVLSPWMGFWCQPHIPSHPIGCKSRMLNAWGISTSVAQFQVLITTSQM